VTPFVILVLEDPALAPASSHFGLCFPHLPNCQHHHGEPVEASGSRGSHREAVGDMWETGKGSEGVQEGQERSGRSGRPWESAEEMGRHRKVTLHYSGQNKANFLMRLSFWSVSVEIGAFISVLITVLEPVNLIVVAILFMPVLNHTVNYCYRNSQNY